MKEILHNRVFELRTHVGMTQEELARTVGVTRQTILAIEKGNYAPSVALAIKVATVFHKKVEDVFSIK